MRRTTLTLFLTVTAMAAVLLAPRLMGEPVHQGPGLEVLPSLDIDVAPRPNRIGAIQRIGPEGPIAPPQAIPELHTPVETEAPTPVETAAPPADFWPDMIDCGMG